MSGKGGRLSLGWSWLRAVWYQRAKFLRTERDVEQSIQRGRCLRKSEHVKAVYGSYRGRDKQDERGLYANKTGLGQVHKGGLIHKERGRERERHVAYLPVDQDQVRLRPDAINEAFGCIRVWSSETGWLRHWGETMGMCGVRLSEDSVGRMGWTWSLQELRLEQVRGRS